MRIEASDILRTMYNRFGQSDQDYNPYTEFQGQNDGFEYSTLGPGNNEGIQTYSFNKSSHKLRYVHYISPDILLVHQSKMVGFYLKMGSGDILKPVDRLVKNQILRDAVMR